MNKPFPTFVNAPYPKGSITQYFGENPELYTTVCAAPNVCLTGGHNGLDIVAPWGTPIFPVENGTVVEVKEDSGGYGKRVRILNKERTKEWVYGHLSKINCVLGQELTTEDCLGNMGNTGFVVSGSTPFWKYNPYAGTHLHLGLRCFEEWNGTGTYNISYGNGIKGNILDYNNGFLGSVNFTFDEPEDLKINQMLTIISLANHAISLLKQLLQRSNK